MRPAGKRTLPRGFGRWIIAGVAILALGVVLQCLWPNGMPMETGQKQTAATAVSEIHGTGPVRLNELMSSNSGTLMDAGGAKPEAMIGSGNGLRKNRHLQRAFERVFSCPMTLSRCEEEAACGAARWALACRAD